MQEVAGEGEGVAGAAVGDPLAEVAADRFRKVVQVGNHLLEAVTIEQVEDVRHDRAVEYRDHGLRELVGDGSQAGAETGGENHRAHSSAR